MGARCLTARRPMPAPTCSQVRCPASVAPCGLIHACIDYRLIDWLVPPAGLGWQAGQVLWQGRRRHESRAGPCSTRLLTTTRRPPPGATAPCPPPPPVLPAPADDTSVDPSSFSAPDVFPGMDMFSDMTHVGSELPIPNVDPGERPPAPPPDRPTVPQPLAPAELLRCTMCGRFLRRGLPTCRRRPCLAALLQCVRQ